MNASLPEDTRSGALAEERPPRRPLTVGGSPGRFAGTLVLALVATMPGFEAALAGREPLPQAAAQFLAAFAILWVIGCVAAAVLGGVVPGAAGNDR